MDENPRRSYAPTWQRLVAPLAIIAALLAAALAGPALAQETPEPTEATPFPTPEATHVAQEDPALLRLTTSEMEVKKDEEFTVEVRVEDVENLASFGVTIDFPEQRATFLRADDIGAFLETSDRQLLCDDASIRENGVSINCVTPDFPFCQGGPAGASGSGLLARLTFKVRTEGDINLQLADPTLLVLDDPSPCDPEAGQAVEIEHRREGVSLNATSSGGGNSSWLLIALVVGIAVVVLAGAGGAALVVIRRRESAR